MLIAIVCVPVWDVVNFEILHSFLIKPLSGQKCKYPKNEKFSR